MTTVTDALAKQLTATARCCVPRPDQATVVQYHEDVVDWCRRQGARADQCREATLTVLARWRQDHREWPPLADLLVAIDAAARSMPERTLRLASPGDDGRETWAARQTRLDLAGRLARIGVAQYRRVMAGHHQRTDAEILGALDRLEAGRPAWPEAEPERDPAALRRALAIIDDDDRWPTPVAPTPGDTWQHASVGVRALRRELREAAMARLAEMGS